MSMFRRIGGAFGSIVDRLSTIFAVQRDQGLGGYLRNIKERVEDQFGEAAIPGDDEPAAPQSSIEHHDFGGRSEDINWIEYDRDRSVLTVCFHYEGRIYEYDAPYEQYQNLILGPGPFPRGRDPHYLKPVSTGQYMNFSIRNDHKDNKWDYRRLV